MLSEIQEIERLIREANSVDKDRTRRIRETFLNVLSLVEDESTVKALVASFVVAHTNFEIALARDCEPEMIDAKRRECLGALAQMEREIDSSKAN